MFIQGKTIIKKLLTAQGEGGFVGSEQTIPDGQAVQEAEPPREYCNSKGMLMV